MANTVRLRVKEVLDVGVDANSESSLLFSFQDLFFEVFGQEVCITCPGKIAGGVDKLRTWYTTNQNNTSMDQRKFELKEGVLITQYGDPIDYTRANMTDEAAIKLLSKSPSHIQSFSRYPENWEELVKNALGDVDYSPEGLKTLNMDQLKRLAKQNGLKGYGRMREDALIARILEAHNA